MTGLMSVNGDATTGPMRLGTAIVDMGTGLYSAIGILMALHERDAFGPRPVSRHDAVRLRHGAAASAGGELLPQRQAAGRHRQSASQSGAVRQVPDQDLRHLHRLAATTVSSASWRRSSAAPELADDPRFADNGKRNVNRAALTEVLAAAFAEHDGNELALKLIRNGVPAGPVLPVDEATAAPHTAHREMVTELDWYRGIGTPIKLRRTPGGTRRPPPKFAQDGAEVLAQHGYTADEIAALQRDGVVLTERRK